jgi:hypothetical protein
VPLLLSAPLGLIAVFMRMRLDESPAYQGESQEAPPDDDPRQYRRTIAEQWKPMLICAALVYTSNAADYMLTGYLPTYLKVLVRIGPTAALAMITATLTILAILLVFVAALSDRIGVKPIMRTGCGLLVVASIPAFLLIRHGGGIPLIFIGVLLIGLMELCFDSTSPATMPALFPTNVRNGALAISYNVAISAFGGTTPRSSIGVRHRRPHGAGVHADRRGVGGRGDAVFHTGSCRSPAAGIAADGRDRARGPCVGRGRGVGARHGRGLGDYGVFVVSVMLPPPP